MKRELIIILVFAAILLLICIVGFKGCGGRCDSLTVEQFDSKKDLDSNDSATLSGLHIEKDIIDCYWFPTACGYYKNDITGISRVVCGWDCTLTECYGEDQYENKTEDHISIEETRATRVAVENEDYRIDSFTVRLYDGELKTFEFDHNVTMDEIVSALKLISMVAEETEIYLTIQYTAFTDLKNVQLYGDVIYEGYEWQNYLNSYRTVEGELGEDTFKMSNILPGKHVITAVLPFNFYAMVNLEDITVNFSATAYVEE